MDVYRGDSQKANSLTNYLLFVFLFPQLIAGPIVRYKEIALQITNRFEYDHWQMRLSGFFRFIIGLAKKVLIADRLSILADVAFNTEGVDASQAWLSLLAYGMQIYFDFSGYSDMAVGLGQMIGFRFSENFNWPYLSAGFQEFWHRWHMTLGHFMRDYLYLPLGGSRISTARTFINLWLVFLLSGFWHGASWNFLVWGLWHGIFISLDRFSPFFKRTNQTFAVAATFLLVMLGWVWFRAETVPEAINFITQLFSGHFETPAVSASQATALVIAFMFSLLPSDIASQVVNVYHSQNAWSDVPKALAMLVLLGLSLAQISLSDGQPFIYFRF